MQAETPCGEAGGRLASEGQSGIVRGQRRLPLRWGDWYPSFNFQHPPNSENPMKEGVLSLSEALGSRYRLERELGQGGMATVYLAEDLKHGRRVAIKVLRPDLAAVIGAERFLREIKTIAVLQHPHILGLIDSVKCRLGVLRHALCRWGIPSGSADAGEAAPDSEATRIATEVASALDYAHRHGVIHRDIKPENILLHDDTALVADFGIALAVSSAGGTRMTETGLSLGTPHYMSPEQSMGSGRSPPAPMSMRWVV
jgi:serine/threonine-protein kinase